MCITYTGYTVHIHNVLVQLQCNTCICNTILHIHLLLVY